MATLQTSPFFGTAVGLLDQLAAMRNEALQGHSQGEILCALEHVYDSADVSTQYKILTEIIEMRCEDARPFIRRILRESPSALVRHEAAFGLGCFGNPSDREILTDALLHDAHSMVRHEAALALVRMGDMGVLPDLERAAEEREEAVAESAQYAIQEYLFANDKKEKR